MLLPAIQYGDWATVSRRMKKVVTQLKRGADLQEIMTRDGMLDPSEHPGLIMLKYTMGRIPCFYGWAPWRQAHDAMWRMRVTPTCPSNIEEAMFQASLRTPWGILGLLSPDSVIWFREEHRLAPFLRAALEFWDELDAQGERYYTAGSGESLWTGGNNLHHVLARMGVPGEILRAPLPPGGPGALLRYARN